MMRTRPRNESVRLSRRAAGSCARVLLLAIPFLSLSAISARAEESVAAEPRLSCTGMYAYRADDLGNIEEISALTDLPRFSIDRRTGEVAGNVIGNRQTTFEFIRPDNESGELMLRVSWLDKAGVSHSLAVNLVDSGITQPFIWSDMQVIYTGTCV